MEGVFSNGEGGDFLKCGEGGVVPLYGQESGLEKLFKAA